ncbi:hypothetical protein BS50DRAFT_90275 [Corynespora cassiicola Philippines]|uniref:Uncharacterized protein n=1 Tax=Corynespora cassiicola Philippines TaxID=1448308 RepID=A0A2T2NEG7_CORCC|nr:hypothetical protein BS50DRAFT_90275 [Corynespora cassiicola Philippines]
MQARMRRLANVDKRCPPTCLRWLALPQRLSFMHHCPETKNCVRACMSGLICPAGTKSTYIHAYILSQLAFPALSTILQSTTAGPRLLLQSHRTAGSLLGGLSRIPRNKVNMDVHSTRRSAPIPSHTIHSPVGPQPSQRRRPR